jgi:hypothetical protein
VEIKDIIDLFEGVFLVKFNKIVVNKELVFEKLYILGSLKLNALTLCHNTKRDNTGLVKEW